MSGRRWLPYIVLLVAAASLACGDTTGPTKHLGKRTSVNAPTGASFGRYILISGAWTCVEDCDEGGGGSGTSRTDGLPGLPDTLRKMPIPVDTSTTFSFPRFGF
jgi:hypothetical protein